MAATGFADPAYVDTWVAGGGYPRIHDDIAYLAAASIPQGATVLDLCSSTGLLGRRLVDLGYRVYGLEADQAARATGIKAGIYGPDGVSLLPISRLTLEKLVPLTGYLKARKVTAVVARRCLPELSDVMPIKALARALVAGGVDTLIVEGRVTSARSTHPLGSLTAELVALAPIFEPCRLVGRCAHLRRGDQAI